MKTLCSDINSHDGVCGDTLPLLDPSTKDDSGTDLKITFHLFGRDNPTKPTKEISFVQHVEAGGQKLADKGEFDVLFPNVYKMKGKFILTSKVTGSICCCMATDPEFSEAFVRLANEEGAAAIIVKKKPRHVQSDIPILEVKPDTLSKCKKAKSVKVTVGIVGPASHSGAVAKKPDGNGGSVSQQGITANMVRVYMGIYHKPDFFFR